MVLAKEKKVHIKTWSELYSHPFRKISLNLKTPKWKSNNRGKQYALFACFWNLLQERICCTLIILVASGLKIKMTISFKRNTWRAGGRSQDGRGIGRGDHFLPHKFIERTTEHRANFTKQLLIASWGHQEPRKAAHCLRKEVGQNIKDKKKYMYLGNF